MRNKIKRSSRGFLTLLTAILTSAILGLLVLKSSYAIFLTRIDGLNSSNRLKTEALASSCAYETFYLYLENLSNQQLPQLITVYQDQNLKETCVIDSFHIENNLLHVVTHASIQNAYTSLETTAQLATSSKSIILSISWKESTSTPP